MFDTNTYVARRKKLKERMKTGVILFPGNSDMPINYTSNTYYFRQDSSFLYFFGIDKPGFFGLIDIDENKDYVFGDDFTVSDIIWMGPQKTVKDGALMVGVENTGSNKQLEEKIKDTITKNRKTHFLPQYRANTILQLEKLLGIANNDLNNNVSKELIEAVVNIRSLKTEIEIKEIEKALAITYEMYSTALKTAKPGVHELEIIGKFSNILSSQGVNTAFPTILSTNGEILHNHHHNNILKENDLLLIDSGAESQEYYASDITRTIPVSGKFTPMQRDIHQIVLNSQQTAIDSIKPGVFFKEVHIVVAKVIAQGLKDIGLIKGDIESAVKEGVHALFFPHGLGHMLGLDVHDMESIGESYVGYNKTVKRSDQFGLAYLRMAKELKPGYIVTVEPGIYFIPALIDQWKAENKCKDFLNYPNIEKFRNFGGIRIEDDVVVTEESHRVLGKPIPKTINDIESVMG